MTLHFTNSCQFFSSVQLQFLEKRNFVESTFFTDVKILLIAICCVLGYVSHFVCKFPRDANEVGMCLAAYCVLMFLHWYIESYKEKGAFFIGKSHEVSERLLLKLISRVQLHLCVCIAKCRCPSSRAGNR